jgi:iron complex transport system substrate-binding protein
VLSRRGFFGVAGAAGLLAVGACGEKKSATGAPSGSVTVKHRFGETTVPAPPKQVVSAGLTGQDDLLAVGIVPIAVTNWWGDQPLAVWPWAQPKLGAAQPTVLSLADGLQFDQIAALKPDLIVATNAGVDQETYNRLSGIAPTILQGADQPPFFEPWKVQARTIAQTVSQPDQMSSLIGQIDNKFTEIAKAHPQFGGKTALLLEGSISQDTFVAAMPSWRTEFLTQMGFAIPESALSEFKVDDRAIIPRDKATAVLDTANVLIWTTESPEDAAKLAADPTFKHTHATAQGYNIITGKDLTGAIEFSSPLSLPVVADQLTPMLAKIFQ